MDYKVAIESILNGVPVQGKSLFLQTHGFLNDPSSELSKMYKLSRSWVQNYLEIVPSWKVVKLAADGKGVECGEEKLPFSVLFRVEEWREVPSNSSELSV